MFWNESLEVNMTGSCYGRAVFPRRGGWRVLSSPSIPKVFRGHIARSLSHRGGEKEDEAPAVAGNHDCKLSKK